MMYIASVFAQLERETTAQRIKDNLKRLAATGRYIGSTPPTGFKSEKINYIDLNGNKKSMHRLIPTDKEIEFVKLLYDKFIEFNSLSRLERWLIQNGIKNKNDNFIGSSEIRRILTNPVYVKASDMVYDYYNTLGSEILNKKEDFNGKNAMFIYGRHDRLNSIYNPEVWRVVIAEHKGIIEDKKWLEVQKKLNNNKLKAPKAGKSAKGLLSSKIKCGLCGSSMVMIYGADKKRYYYKCSKKRKSRGSACSIKNITGIDADNEILNYLKILSLDKNINSEMLKCKNIIQPESNSNSIEEKNIKNLITEKQKEIKNLMMELKKNKNSSAAKYIVSEIESLDSELQLLKNSLEKLKNKNICILEKNSLTINSLMDLNIDNGFSFDEKRRYIDNIIDKIIWDGVKMIVFFR